MKCLGVGVLALAAFAAPARAQTITVGVGGRLSALLYEDFRIPIYADLRGAPTQKLGSYTVRLSWNPAVLSYEYQDSTSFGTFAVPVVREDSAYSGVLYLGGISAAGKGGVFDLASLKFQMVSAGSTPVTLQVRELSAAGTFADLLPITTVVSGSYCPARGRWGDLDFDGRSNSRDALAVLSSVVALPVDTTLFKLAMGDVDGDGLTNSRDALIILSYAVGLQIPGQRVLLVAGGACVTGGTPSVAVVPDTSDLAVGQELQLFVLANDGSGRPSTVTGVNWSVADERVAFVDRQGRLAGRDTGTTTVTASFGPGIRYTGTVVVRRRRVWYVDAPRAARSTIQLGTQRYPFANPPQAFGLLSEGDTVRIAPGVHDYGDDYYYYYAPLRVGAVFIGDTLPDGTRPVLRANEDNYQYAFYWRSGGRAVLRDLVIRGFYIAVEADGVRSLLVENVRIEEPSLTNRYGYGIYADGRLDSLVVQRSNFVADTAGRSYEAIYVSDGVGLLKVWNSTFRNWGYETIFAYNADSADIQGNVITGSSYVGIEMYRGGGGGGGTTGVRLSRNRISTRYGDAVYLDDIRVAALDHNYFDVLGGSGIYVYGQDLPGSRVTMLGDSVRFRSGNYDWLYAVDFDSVRVDSLWFENSPSPVYEYGYVRANAVRVTNSKFLNVYYSPLDVDTRSLVVNNSQFVGCPTCDRAAYVLYVGDYAGVGPSITLTNSTFSNVYQALYYAGAYSGAGPMVVTGNTVDSARNAIYLYGDSAVVTDNVLTRIAGDGVYLSPTYTSGAPRRTAALLRNQVTCSPGGSGTALWSEGQPARFEDNTVNGCGYGLYAYNIAADPVRAFTALRNAVFLAATSNGVPLWADGAWTSTIVGNRVRYGQSGIIINGTTAGGTAVVDSNAASLASIAGIRVSAGTVIPVTGRKNNVTGNLYGLMMQGSGTRRFTLGRIVGNTGYGVYNFGAAQTVDATQNWWGNAAGPGGGVADSTLGAVTTAPPLTAEPTDVPPPGPALAGATVTAASLRAGATDLPAPPARGVVRGETAGAARSEASAARQAEFRADAARRKTAQLLERQRVEQFREAQRAKAGNGASDRR